MKSTVMHLKQRICSVLFLIIFVVLLTYLTVQRIVPDEQMKISRNGETAATRFIMKYEEYVVNVNNLKFQVHKIKKKFLVWKDQLLLKRKRKNITIDILNDGDQLNCKDLTVIHMVSSEISHLGRRNLIRSTWINQTHWKEYNTRRKVSFGMLFIVGRTKNETAAKLVREESKKYGDLLILDLDESFYSLSYKVMIGFQWITDNCAGYKFLLKGDDDIFVNNHALMNLLHEPKTPKDHLYVGNRMYVSEVIRNGRYGVSREEYKRDNYPRYNSGGGFVMSSDVVSKMIPHFDWKAPLKIDDAFMGALILKAGVDCIADERFHMYDRGCNFAPNTIVSHADDKIVMKPKCAKHLNDEALKDGMKYLKTLL